MRERIIIFLFTLSHILSVIADELRTEENEGKEYFVSFLGKTGEFL